MSITPADLERFAIPIGIGLAILFYILSPAARKFLKDSNANAYEKGKKLRKRMTGKDEK